VWNGVVKTPEKGFSSSFSGMREGATADRRKGGQQLKKKKKTL